jgi:uncharacterized membrane protein YesL
MRFWIRELAGWLLVGLGLFIFYQCYRLLMDRESEFVQAVVMTVIGIFVFRGGIHLLKVAVAARVCMDARERLQKETRTGASPVTRR